MPNFFSRVGNHFKRQVAQHKQVARTVVRAHENVAHVQLNAINRAAYYTTPRAAAKSWDSIKDYSKRSVRLNSEGLAKFNTAFTGAASFVLSLFPVLGTAAAQVVTAIGYGQGRYLGGVEGRAEGRHGNEAHKVGRMRGNQALMAGEAGATLGFLAVAAAPAAGGAAAGTEAGTAGGTLAVEGAAKAAPALAASEAAAVPASTAVAANEATAAGSILSVKNVSAGLGLLSTAYGLVQKFILKQPAPKSGEVGGAVASGGGPVGIPGNDSSESDSAGGFPKIGGSSIVLVVSAFVGGVVLFKVMKRKAA